jgi:hypothetical protein
LTDVRPDHIYHCYSLHLFLLVRSIRFALIQAQCHEFYRLAQLSNFDGSPYNFIFGGDDWA